MAVLELPAPRLIETPRQEGVPTVLELLESRRAGKTDQYRLALVIQGGALRAATTAGMVEKLYDQGFHHELFDAGVYGSSMGALSGMYYILGEHPAMQLYDGPYVPKIIKFGQVPGMLGVAGLTAALGRPLHWLSKKFGKGVFDLDYLFDVIQEKFSPDLAKIPQGKLKILLSNLSQVEAEIVDTFDSKQDLLNTMRLAISIPPFSGQPGLRKNRKTENLELYADAAIVTTHPLDVAIKDATHVLSLSTEPTNNHQKPTILSKIIAQYVKRLSGNRQKMAEIRAEKDARYEKLPHLIKTGDLASNSPQVLDVRPTIDPPEVTKNPSTIMRGIKDGILSMHVALTREDPNDLMVTTTRHERPGDGLPYNRYHVVRRSDGAGLGL